MISVGFCRRLFGTKLVKCGAYVQIGPLCIFAKSTASVGGKTHRSLEGGFELALKDKA